LSANLVPIFADRRCHVARVNSPPVDTSKERRRAKEKSQNPIYVPYVVCPLDVEGNKLNTKRKTAYLGIPRSGSKAAAEIIF
jgi:hypothetical protein